MKLRTMEELEAAMIENKITRSANLCKLAIEAGHASNAAHFAAQAVRASRELPEADDLHQEAERFAEPMLRLANPAVTRAIMIEPTERGYKFALPELCAPSPAVVKALRGQRCIAYHASELGDVPYRTFPEDQLSFVVDFLKYWFAEQDPRGERGRSRNGSQCVPVQVISQNDAATVRWSNEDFADVSKMVGGVLVIKREAA